MSPAAPEPLSCLLNSRHSEAPAASRPSQSIDTGAAARQATAGTPASNSVPGLRPALSANPVRVFPPPPLALRSAFSAPPSTCRPAPRGAARLCVKHGPAQGAEARRDAARHGGAAAGNPHGAALGTAGFPCDELAPGLCLEAQEGRGQVSAQCSMRDTRPCVCRPNKAAVRASKFQLEVIFLYFSSFKCLIAAWGSISMGVRGKRGISRGRTDLMEITFGG